MRNKVESTYVVRNKDTKQLETICLDTGEVVSSNINLEKFKFNQETAMLICQAIREGATLKGIDADPDLPSLSVLHYWRRTNATFDEEIRLARKDRAEYYHDKVLQIADDTVDKDEVAVNKFKVDQYKWAAEKGDPASYGNKIEHTGNNTAPSIVVITGISRPKDVEVEYEEVQDTGTEQPDGGSDGRGIQAICEERPEEEEGDSATEEGTILGTERD